MRQLLCCMKVFLPVGIFTLPSVAHVSLSVAVAFELTLEEYSLKKIRSRCWRKWEVLQLPYEGRELLIVLGPRR